MAINEVVFPTVPNPLAGDWSKIVSLVSKSFQNVNDPLQVVGTNIPQGATFQVGGIVFYADSDTAITGTESDYVKLTVSGTTLVPSFVTTLTGVNWNKVWNGYYDTSDNLYLFSEIKISSVNTKYGELASLLMPIGFTYTQYPTKLSPADLGLPGVWTNISSSFAGDFFRAEGGNAAAFESGEQAFSTDLKAHTHNTVIGAHAHNFNEFSYGTSGPSIYRSGGVGVATSGFVLSTDLGTKTSGNPSTGGDAETRPVNMSIRIWERTA